MSIKQRSKSLQSRQVDLSNAFFQLEVLNQKLVGKENIPSFHSKVLESQNASLHTVGTQILQLNVGKLCNQSCAHCHVDAAPHRTEIMPKEIFEHCLRFIKASNIKTVDITGGAPELNPHFRWFVESLSELGCHIMDRCNLTIIVSNPKYHDLPDFFAKHKVQVISSLPYYSASRTDSQRGEGVFDDSIRALHMLNKVGYGIPDSGLILDLVFNPSGAFLPGKQAALEKEFKTQLKRRYDIDFNQLYAITNLPVSRFLDYLIESKNYESYMQKLLEAFNPATLQGLMCRNTLSVGWDGYLYDCDFNQMLDLQINHTHQHISTYTENPNQHAVRPIVVNQHCYGCTAGAGSSCGGEITN